MAQKHHKLSRYRVTGIDKFGMQVLQLYKVRKPALAAAELLQESAVVDTQINRYIGGNSSFAKKMMEHIDELEKSVLSGGCDGGPV